MTGHADNSQWRQADWWKGSEDGSKWDHADKSQWGKADWWEGSEDDSKRTRRVKEPRYDSGGRPVKWSQFATSSYWCRTRRFDSRKDKQDSFLRLSPTEQLDYIQNKKRKHNDGPTR